MLAKSFPWGPIALVLAVAGLILASVTSARWLPLAPAVLGLVAALVGIVSSPLARDRVWLALGAVLSAGVVGLTLFAPGLLNPLPEINRPVPRPDPNRLVRVAADRPLEAGTALGKEEWVDAAAEGIRQDDLFVAVKAVRPAEPVGNKAPRLAVHLSLRQVRTGPTITFEGFGKDWNTPVLTDEAGHVCLFIGHQPERFSPTLDLVPLRLDHLLIFDMPPAGTGPLKLEVPASAWGRQGACRFAIRHIEREAPPDLAAQIARYRKLLRSPPPTPPDPTLGRALFTKHCAECHTLFGTGGKVGPDLTTAKRDDLDFLVKSIVDPSAEFAKGFEPSVVFTTSGRIVAGIIKESTPEAITVQGTGQPVVVPRADVEEIQPGKVSVMPNELLKSFDEHEVRSLIAYLSGRGQVPMLARPETAVFFSSYGQDLTGWQRARGDWRVDRGEIVAAPPPAGEPPLLVSDMVLADDFRLSLRFHPGKDGRAAVLLRGEEKPSPTVVRVELAAGRPVAIAGVGSGGDNRVAADAWNRLEIRVVGRRLEVRLNGKEAAAAELAFPGRCGIALEGPGIGGEVRFAGLELQVSPAEKGR